jgi:hypothetical protein
MDTKGEELEIPKASIQRVVKASVKKITSFEFHMIQLPEGVQLAKETKVALAKSSRMFIHYLTAW